MSIKVSVIMPVYNSERFFRECLESVVSQTLEDIEILIIDAGSTDDTVKIIEAFRKKDKRIKVIVSDKKSCGAQNNLGVENAAGKYVGFVESDDMIPSKMFEKLYNLAEQYRVDYIKGDYSYFFSLQDGGISKKNRRSMPAELYNHILCPANMPKLVHLDYFMWRGIYRKYFLQKNHIVHNETAGAAFQDIGFLFQTIGLARRAYYTDEVFYQYRKDNDSSSIYNVRGHHYLSMEFEFVKAFLENNLLLHQGFREEYYRRLIEMLGVRNINMIYLERWNDEVTESLHEIRELFLKGRKSGELVRDVFEEEQWMEVNLLLEDPKKYEEHVKYKYGLQRNNLDALLKEYKGIKKLVIFGFGPVGEFVYLLLKKNRMNNIAAFCDNDIKKWGTIYHGTEVVSVAAAVKENTDAVFILTGKNKSDMEQQLIALDVKPENIKYYNLSTSNFALFNYRYDRS